MEQAPAVVADDASRKERLIPDIALPLESLGRINGSVDIRVGTLKRAQLQLRDVELLAGLRDSQPDVRKFAFIAPSGRLDARGSIRKSADTAEVSLDLITRDLSLGLYEQNQDLGTISPVLANKKGSELDCAIVPYEIVDGQLSSSPFAFFGTDIARVSSKMQLNLGTEELLMSIEAEWAMTGCLAPKSRAKTFQPKRANCSVIVCLFLSLQTSR